MANKTNKANKTCMANKTNMVNRAKANKAKKIQMNNQDRLHLPKSRTTPIFITN